MATFNELADTLGSLRVEFLRRLDEIEEANPGQNSGMDGLADWMASLEEAMRNCNGVPTESPVAHAAMTANLAHADAKWSEMTLADAEAALSNRVYEATLMVEKLQRADKLFGNGHHARQEIAGLAVEAMRARWNEKT